MAHCSTDSMSDIYPGPDHGTGPRQSAPEPGLVLLFSSGKTLCTLIPLGPQPLELGRGLGMLSEHPDSMMSRRHAQVAYRQGLFEVADLGSRNGSTVNGTPLHEMRAVPGGTLLRCGHSLFYCCSDLEPFRRLGVRAEDGRVEGPALQQVMQMVVHFAAASRTLFIYGESGVGKESMAQAFHRAGPNPDGPMITVNCAAIPEGVAERLLFGARKGSFSGATGDSEGYLEAASGGTLFLDEIADLDPKVQGKLLRALDSGELLPLGSTRARKIEFRLCAATHKDLRSLSQAGTFRSDLYFRIATPEVAVPSLRQRREEIPWLIGQAATRAAPRLAVDALFVEACMLRAWPGNVRELLLEVRSAALAAQAAKQPLLTERNLRQSAGIEMQASALPLTTPARQRYPEPPEPLSALLVSNQQDAPSYSVAPKRELSRVELLAALLATNGNISAAARAAGIHLTQFRRLLNRHKINATKLRGVNSKS